MTRHRSEICWGFTEGGLQLGLSTADGTAGFHLKNVGDAPLIVLSHVSAETDHFDWFELKLVNESGTERVLRFIDDRDKAGSVSVTLRPNDTLDHSVNLSAWARRPINGSRALAKGHYRAWLTYEVTSGDNGNWVGRLEAGPASITV